MKNIFDRINEENSGNTKRYATFSGAIETFGDIQLVIQQQIEINSELEARISALEKNKNSVI